MTLPVISNPGTVSLKSATIWLGYGIAAVALLLNSVLPALAHIWGWSLPLPQMQDTWNNVLVPALAGFGIHAARLWNQNIPGGTQTP